MGGAQGFMGSASGRARKSPGGRSENLTAGASHVITAENTGYGSLQWGERAVG